ncbi:MAG: DUF3800 domain-containing protein [Actinomycetota bacterium]|nr:DUF3800 domain-containing protein [Actinomycetota bacterium]
MARVYVFADEAGNFDFSRNRGASRYFILGTMTVADPALGTRLLDLRRELAWRGHGLETSFHAVKDRYEVKNVVFKLLEASDFRFDVVALEKSKAQPHLRADWEYFYKMAWFLHFRFVGPRILGQGDDLMVTAASIGTRKLRNAIDDVVWQSAWPKVGKHQVAFWAAESDPCIQAADYVTWAVQRKWEIGDRTWYDRIAHKISTEFDAWWPGRTHYY